MSSSRILSGRAKEREKETQVRSRRTTCRAGGGGRSSGRVAGGVSESVGGKQAGCVALVQLLLLLLPTIWGYKAEAGVAVCMREVVSTYYTRHCDSSCYFMTPIHA